LITAPLISLASIQTIIAFYDVIYGVWVFQVLPASKNWKWAVSENDKAAYDRQELKSDRKLWSCDRLLGENRRTGFEPLLLRGLPLVA
jgi:hypothetical protein